MYGYTELLRKHWPLCLLQVKAAGADKAHYVSAAGVKRPRDAGSAKQLPIEQRLNNLSMTSGQSEPSSKHTPSSDSLAQLLAQVGVITLCCQLKKCIQIRLRLTFLLRRILDLIALPSRFGTWENLPQTNVSCILLIWSNQTNNNILSCFLFTYSNKNIFYFVRNSLCCIIR